MQNQKLSSNRPSTVPFVMPDLTKGLYQSNTINKHPSVVYEFVKQVDNLKKVLSDLPEELENFMDLKISDAVPSLENNFTVKFTNNPEAKVQGELTIQVTPGPAGKGSVITAMAAFGSFSSSDEGPSDLMNVFLKRIKAMIETGVLATTKNQPNGKDEFSNTERNH